MLKIFLVDDEIMSIDYFKSVFSSSAASRYAKVVGYSTRPMGAINDIERLVPDIVFLDITMPGMNGIELAKRILSRFSHIKIILLTAHKDFEYAQKGLQLGVFNYLIKHELSGEILEEEIKKIIEIQNREQKLSYLEKCEEFGRFINSPAKNSDNNIDGMFLKGVGCILVVVDRVIVAGELSDNTPANTTGFDEALNEYLMTQGNVGTKARHNEWFCAVNILDSFSAQEAHSTLRQHSDCIIKLAKGENIGVSCIFSNYCNTTIDLPTIYNRMREMKDRLFFVKSSVAVPIWLLQQNDNLSYTEADLNQLQNLLVQKEFSLVQQEVKNLLNQAQGSKLIREYLSTVQSIDRLISEFLVEYEVEDFPSYHDTSFASTENVAKFLEDKILSFTDTFGVQYSQELKRCIRCIHENYSDPEFSARSLEELCMISERKIRHIFSKELSESPSTYITSYRIKAAIELMKNNNCKIQTLYSAVGFSSSSYFIQVFKKHTGLPPKQYLQSRNIYPV